MMKKLLGVLILGVLLIGCEGKAVDSNMTLSQITEAVKTMDLAQIQSKIGVYKQEIEKKAAELEPIVAKLKEIPITEMMGDEAKKIKADITEIQDAIKVLREKMDVYVQAYNSMK